MQDIDTTVLGVQQSPTRTGGQMFKVALGDGQTYTTFNPNVANKAYSLTGQQVTARVNAAPSRDQRYMNYNLEDIAPQGQLAPMAMPVQGGTPAFAGAPMGTPMAGPPMSPGGFQANTPPPGGPIPQATPQSRGMSDEDKARIVRQSASSTAFSFIAALFQGAGPEGIAEAFDHARRMTESLVRHAWTGSFDTQAETQQEQPQAQAPQTAQEVAAQVPGVQTGSEIPWGS